LCEPPAFFCGARAFRPPAAAPSGGQRRAVARGRLPGLRRRPVEAFRPRRIRHDHRHRACPIGWKRGEAGGTGGGARRSPGEHGAHRGNCAGAIASPVPAPPTSPGLVLDHRLELAAEPLVKGFRGLGGGEIGRRDTGRLVRKAAMRTDLQRRSIRAPNSCKINESHQLYLTGLFLVLGL
jgi:hypothetical protein